MELEHRNDMMETERRQAMKPWKKGILTLCMILFLLSGCTVSHPEVQSEEKEEDLSVMEQSRVYPIEIIPGYLWLTDRNGNPVQPQDSTDFLFDLVSHQPVYRVRTRRYLSGKTDEAGQPVYRNTMALSTLQDELIRDFDEVIYESAFGHYVICRDYLDEFDMMLEVPDSYSTALIDSCSGQVIQNGVFQVKVLDDQHLLALDKDHCLMGILDPEGQFLIRTENNRKIRDPEAVRGKILAQENGQSVILDDQLDLIYSAQRINALYKGLHGPYFIESSDRDKVMDMDTLEEVLTLSEDRELIYFDGQLQICYQEEDGRMIMEDVNENRILTADLIINAQSHTDRTPATRFLCMNDEKAMVIDREGKTLFSIEIPGLCGLYCDREGIYYYEVEDSEGKVRMGVLDEDLDIVIPAMNYETVSTAVLQDDHLVPLDYYLAVRTEDQKKKTDILDKEGNVVFEGADRICLCGLDRFALVREQEAGLIDGQGNWIVVRQIYPDEEEVQ